MGTNRRSVLKASGIAALLGTTGLAGCSDDLLSSEESAGADAGPASWQFDPSGIVSAENQFFGSMQYDTIYDSRQFFPESQRRQIEASGETSPVDPGEIDFLSGVGAVSVPTGSSDLQAGGGGTGVGAVAITGSFEKETLTGEIESQGQVEQVGEYEGYTLYQAQTDGVTTTPLSTTTGPGIDQVAGQSGAAVVGLGSGAVVIGGASTENSTGDARTVVETAIDSNGGSGQRLRQSNQQIDTVASTLDEPTFAVGGAADPELVDFAVMGADSGTEGFIRGFRAGGVGMSLNGATTVFDGVLVYSDSSQAEQTGIVSLVNNVLAPDATESEGINSIEASRDGATITVTIEGDTQTLLEQGSGSVPGGGVGI